MSELDSAMSKTLHNGVVILELLVAQPRGMTLTEIADALGVHRTVAHRLVRTLEAHRLCKRDRDKRITLAAGLVRLAEPVEQDLRTLALPVLEDLAEQTQASAHLVVRDSEDEARMLMIVEPRRARMHVSFRAGQVDPVDRGSAGLALLSEQPPAAGERDEVTTARRRGFAVSYGEVVPSVCGVSAPVPGREVSIGLTLFEIEDEDGLGRIVCEAAKRLGAQL